MVVTKKVIVKKLLDSNKEKGRYLSDYARALQKAGYLGNSKRVVLSVLKKLVESGEAKAYSNGTRVIGWTC